MYFCVIYWLVSNVVESINQHLLIKLRGISSGEHQGFKLAWTKHWEVLCGERWHCGWETGPVDLTGLALQPTQSTPFSGGRWIKGTRNRGSRRVDALDLHGSNSVAVFCWGVLVELCWGTTPVLET